MTKVLPQDRLVSHSIINYLLAGYQCRFTFLNMLSQLGYPNLKEDFLTKTRQAIDKVTTWTEDLWEDKPLFLASWTTPETDDAKMALALLGDLKPELISISQELARILMLPNPGEKKQDISFLVSAFGRYSYTRENYIRGFLEFGQNFKLEKDTQSYGPLLPPAQEDLRTTHAMLAAVKDSFKEGVKSPFVKSIIERSYPLIPAFRTHIHDINQLLARYMGGLTYERADFNATDASKWRAIEVGPEVAGYWRANGFKPEDAEAWIKGNIANPPTAAAWRMFGFDAESAAPWIRHNFPPAFSRMWNQSGFSAAQAKELIERGVTDPSKVTPPSKN